MNRLSTLGIAALLVPALAGAQAGASPEARIRAAMSAAPPQVAANATIMDWPAEHGGEPVQLRAGSNGWVCFPDMPETPGNDPMCLDEVWMGWAQALMSRTAPRVERMGIGYMMAPGGAHGSNTDPFATGPTADNEWGHDPPHLMIVVPDPAALEGLPTTRESGGPWVMFRGTPYAHVMVPLEAGRTGRRP